MMSINHFKDIYRFYPSIGLTVKSFCGDEGLPESRFYYWQRRLRHCYPETENFIPLVIQPAGQGAQAVAGVSSSGKELSCEISYPNGIRMKLQGEIDGELLRNVLSLSH
jgi:hypothetical protein